MSDVATEFQYFAHVPFIISATIGACDPSADGTSTPKCHLIRSTWSQRDLIRMEKMHYQKSHLITENDHGQFHSQSFGVPVDITSEKRTTFSSDGSLKAVFAKFKPNKKKPDEESEAIEIYNSVGKIATNDLGATKRHGKFYTDNEMGSFELNPVVLSTHLLYVAEKYQPKSESFFSVLANKFPSDPELSNKALGQEFVYRDDWGEQLQKKCQPVLCVLDWKDNKVSILDNIPVGISPAQPVWTVDGGGIVFVGFDHEPERLGLIYCPARKSRLYYLALGESKMALPLTFEDLAVRCPRFNLDGTALVYLETEVGGPHMRALRLMKIDWRRQEVAPVTVIPVPSGDVKQEDFPGLYTASLPQRCWSSDNKRIVFSTIWRSSQEIVLVDTESKELKRLTGPGQLGSGLRLPKWEVLDVYDDIIVASASSPNICPRLYFAKLPGSGEESRLEWVVVDEGAAADKEFERDEFDWNVEVIRDPVSGLDYEAVAMFPRLAQKPSIILWPHGGPHAVSVPGFDVFISTLIRMDYAVIYVNYRGSVGFGETSLNSLLGKIGQNDVEDCFRALEVVLKRRYLKIDDVDVFYQGGSHGGFLGAHLIGQFPDVFKACVLRNPVINLASMFNSTDIPDWTYVECGIPYPYHDPPTLPPFEQLRSRSPIVHVGQVKTPTLIMIGDKDRRVPPCQGMEFYRALKLRGTPTRVMRYPDSEHPISEIEAESDSFVQMVLWFREFGRKR